VKSKATCIAYETVTSPTGGLPLLAPMSEVAGRLSIQAGAYYLEKAHGGHGLLLGGVPGVDPAKVVVIGGGVVGRHAIHIALGMGADVWVIDKNVDVLRSLWAQFDRPLNTVYSTRDAIERHCAEADLVIGGVLIPGAAAPKLITRDIVKSMKAGSVIVDVAIDQGGCFETSRPTTLASPTYEVDGILHMCVPNLPSVAARTATKAFTNATLPYLQTIAEHGLDDALRTHPDLARGVLLYRGRCASEALGRSFGVDWQPAPGVGE